MFKSTVSWIMLTLLLALSLLTFAFNIEPVKSEPNAIIVPDDYPTIQEAINNANEGDTIYVKSETYYEHVVVNKTVSLIGENKSTTFIDGNGTGNVIYIVVSDVVMSGFTIQNGTNGICVSEFYSRITIYENTIIKNKYNAISLRGSSWHNISDNIISLNHIGIKLWCCGRSTISGNTLSQNEYGIELAYSMFFTLRGNIMMNNTYSFAVWSYGKSPYGSFYDFIHDIEYFKHCKWKTHLLLGR